MLTLFQLVKTLGSFTPRKRTVSDREDKTPRESKAIKKSVKIKKQKVCDEHIHDTKRDFPVTSNTSSKYDEVTQTHIILDFGNKRFKLPGCFMHYIDDVPAIGWSWLPPENFIACIKQGYDAVYKANAPVYEIGYLISPLTLLRSFYPEEAPEFQALRQKYDEKKIYDTHGKDRYFLDLDCQRTTEAITTEKIGIAPDILQALKQIYAYAQAMEPGHQFKEFEYEIIEATCEPATKMIKKSL